MSFTHSGRSEVAASLARAARVSAIVLGRMSLARAQVVDAVVATSAGASGVTREVLAAQIARAVAPLVGAGGARPEAGRGAAGGSEAGPCEAGHSEAGHSETGRGAALWLASDRCLVGLWPDPPPVAPFVALIVERPEEVAAPWRRDVARVGLVYETERLRAEPLPAPGGARRDGEGAGAVTGAVTAGGTGGSTGGGAGADRHAMAEEILRLVTIGLVLCDRTGKVIHANPAAEAWMRERSAVAIVGGRLVSRRADLRRRLEAALEAAAVGEPRIPGALALPRGGGDPLPDVLTVMPFAGGACALVVLGGREWDAGRGNLALRALGLTQAERRLVGHLCRGRPLEEAAGEAEVTISTARTYLKRVFAKTGTHRQSELVSLLAALSPPVAVHGPLDLAPPEPACEAPSERVAAAAPLGGRAAAALARPVPGRRRPATLVQSRG